MSAERSREGARKLLRRRVGRLSGSTAALQGVANLLEASLAQAKPVGVGG